MKKIIPLTLAIAIFMEMMNNTIIVTSLPKIAEDLGADPISLNLAMMSYLAAIAIGTPISGWMANRFGPLNIFRWSICVFALASLVCSLSDSLYFLVGARFFQGIGASVITPIARLVLVSVTPKKELMASMNWLTIPALLGPMIGPPLGGYLTTFWSWHWIFLMNIPIAIIGVVASVFFVPTVSQNKSNIPMDWLGFILLAVSLIALLLGLSIINIPAINTTTGIVATLIGIGSCVIYINHTKKCRYPLLDPSVFRKDELFRAAVFGGFLFRISVGASPFLYTLFFQIGFGFSPVDAGFMLLSGVLGSLVSRLFTTQAYRIVGFKRLLIGSMILASTAFALLSTLNAQASMILISLVLFSIGLLRGLFFTGNNALAFADVQRSSLHQATSFLSASVHLSFAIGAALAGMILQISTTIHQAPLSVEDFQISFVIITLIGLVGIFPFVKLETSAGAEVSGHHLPKKA